MLHGVHVLSMEWFAFLQDSCAACMWNVCRGRCRAGAAGVTLQCTCGVCDTCGLTTAQLHVVLFGTHVVQAGLPPVH
jgi:hypothetical protein